MFRAGQQVNLTGLTPGQAHAMGDLNGDFRNDHSDFVLFKTAFEAANGTRSFVAMLTAMPEPSGFLLSLLAGVSLILFRNVQPSRSWNRKSSVSSVGPPSSANPPKSLPQAVGRRHTADPPLLGWAESHLFPSRLLSRGIDVCSD